MLSTETTSAQNDFLEVAAPSVLTNKQPITSESFTKPGHKRRRTVQAQSLTSSLTINSTVQTSNVHTGTTLVINSFLQNSSKLDEKSKLQDQIFSYMLQKHILHHQPKPQPNKCNSQ